MGCQQRHGDAWRTMVMHERDTSWCCVTPLYKYNTKFKESRINGVLDFGFSRVTCKWCPNAFPNRETWVKLKRVLSGFEFGSKLDSWRISRIPTSLNSGLVCSSSYTILDDTSGFEPNGLVIRVPKSKSRSENGNAAQNSSSPILKPNLTAETQLEFHQGSQAPNQVNPKP